jgi:hypothetical protein
MREKTVTDARLRKERSVGVRSSRLGEESTKEVANQARQTDFYLLGVNVCNLVSRVMHEASAWVISVSPI